MTPNQAELLVQAVTEFGCSFQRVVGPDGTCCRECAEMQLTSLAWKLSDVVKGFGLQVDVTIADEAKRQASPICERCRESTGMTFE